MGLVNLFDVEQVNAVGKKGFSVETSYSSFAFQAADAGIRDDWIAKIREAIDNLANIKDAQMELVLFGDRIIN